MFLSILPYLVYVGDLHEALMAVAIVVATVLMEINTELNAKRGKHVRASLSTPDVFWYYDFIYEYFSGHPGHVPQQTRQTEMHIPLRHVLERPLVRRL